MTWLRILASLFALFAAAFAAAAAASFATSSASRDDSRRRLRAALPGWDCGTCGAPDCAGFAARLKDGSARAAQCEALDRESAERVDSLLAREAADPSVAVIACAGARGLTRPRFSYDGLKDCRSAASFYGGDRGCASACLGYGDCVASCPVGAISVRDGLARIDPDRCDGCGDCVTSCPNGVIRMVRDRDSWYVACNSTESADAKAPGCDTACDACRICERLSGNGEFRVIDNLARAVDVSTGTHDEIAAACPRGCIRRPVLAGPEESTLRDEDFRASPYRKPRR
ncbi:MAG TPA: (Fe-S)-binding protein [Spirochaetales bacterium]|nr:(Fe-S)-binding protein [Spirochaetales bacterium]